MASAKITRLTGHLMSSKTIAAIEISPQKRSFTVESSFVRRNILLVLPVPKAAMKCNPITNQPVPLNTVNDPLPRI